MANNSVRLGLIPSLPGYVKERNKEYNTLWKRWVSGATDCQYAPPTWPASRCMLTNLPAELLLLVCERLYQADLFHLALTCRALADVTTDLLYKRDTSDFDCLALRWACTFGIVPTLERTLSYGAPGDHVFAWDSHAKCSWVIGAVNNPLRYECRRPFLETPLSTAIVANEPEIVRLLLAHGVDPSTPDPVALTDYRMQYEALFPINLAMGTPDMECYTSFQPGNPQIICHPLDAGADPNQYSKACRPLYFSPRSRGITPLMMAMQQAVPVETVELLLQRGADPTRVGSFQGLGPRFFLTNYPGEFWDRTPLGAMLLNSAVYDIYPLNMDKIRLLLKHGAVREVAYIRGSIPHPVPLLCRHWDHRHIADVLKLFIDHGADIHGWATSIIHPIFFLIWWAEKFIPRCHRKGAWQTASEAVKKVCDIITLMAEATLVDDCPGPVRKSAIIDPVLPSEGIRVYDIRNDHTPLRHLCRPLSFEGATSVIDVLLRFGADPNSQDPAGRTALHHAALFSSGDRVRALVGGPAASGLLINPVDRNGWTPLHYACLFALWSDPAGQATTARLLLAHGADARAKTHTGWTPLSLAAFAANEALVELLLDHGAHADDLFLPPQKPAGGGEPTLVPIGRILFLDSTTTFPEPMPAFRYVQPSLQRRAAERAAALGSELAVSRACIATLLEHRLGVPVPVKLAGAEGSLGRVNEGTQLRGPPLGSQWRVDMAYHLFGLASMRFDDVTSAEFAEDLDGVAETLDQLALEAWAVTVGPPEMPSVLWQGWPPAGDGDTAGEHSS